MLIMALAPILGPLMGGFLVVAGGWRWTFWAISAVALIIFGLILFLPESLPRRSAIAARFFRRS